MRIELVAALGGLLLAGAGLADEPAARGANEAPAAAASPSGLEQGLRFGYAFPLGHGDRDTTLLNLTYGHFPVQLDAGWRLNPRWFAGGYVQYGLAMLRGCSDTESCSGYDLRFGVQGQYHFAPERSWDPWAGLGTGYEIFHVGVSSTLGRNDTNSTGFEFANLSLGANFPLSKSFGLGPLISATLAEFANVSGAPIPDRGVHLWLSAGLRGVFDVR